MSVLDMEHVLVLSDDIERTRDFYCAVVGLTVGARPPLEFPGYWLYAGEAPCVHIAEREPYLRTPRGSGCRSRRGRRARAPSITSRSPRPTTTAVEHRLSAPGVAGVRNTVPGAGLRQVFIEDPNGVRVEINVRDDQGR